ncbi:hypothetical protein AUC68_09305 [Methyloceanibacter methanicus]|uniref:Uncharacterized protein n=1 Tax=Methyloceanibacter methanicus TaxID=1774968 RepID=A0A1E3VYJ6_9HYPH|nr:hypothetical protein AUC68_09305 [Methyloceanibacter methanicus]
MAVDDLVREFMDRLDDLHKGQQEEQYLTNKVRPANEFLHLGHSIVLPMAIHGSIRMEPSTESAAMGSFNP